MGYSTTLTGTISVDPPLSPRQRSWIVSLGSPDRYPDGSLALGFPGWSSPWLATADGGGLHVPSTYDKPRQAPEWLAWIARELREPLFSRNPDIAGTHAMTGRLRAQGACEGDTYEVRVAGGRISVHRKGPCWPCWRDTQWMVPPSAAYAFAHPDEGQPDVPAHPSDEDRQRDEPRCRAAGWTPQPRWRRVYWPPRFTDWWDEHVATLGFDA